MTREEAITYLIAGIGGILSACAYLLRRKAHARKRKRDTSRSGSSLPHHPKDREEQTNG